MVFSPFTSSGLVPGGNFTDLVSGGVPAAPLPPVPAPSSPTYSITNIQAANPTTGLSPEDLTALQNPTFVRDVNGRIVSPSPTASIDLGQGAVLSFNSSTMDAQVLPVLDPTSGGISVYSDTEAAFSGSSCRIIIEIPQTPSFNGSNIQPRLGKQLIEASAITISTHRAKTQVRPFGYINPKGIARGSRTIAGTLILNRFTTEVLYRFLTAGLMADLSKDTFYNKIDQLPPFIFTLLFTNEQGYISSQTLYGVEFVTDGSVVSVNDILLEQTITYFATDMSPLVPLNYQNLFQPNTTQTGSTANEQTVSGLWSTT
jgi:hypothetical protein